MGIVDLLNVPRLERPAAVARRPRRALHARRRRLEERPPHLAHLARARSTAAQPAQLTSGADGENGPRWSPDGKTIAFTAKRGDDEFAQIYLLPVDGGEARQLTTHASAVSELTWTPDGAAILFQGAGAEDRRREGAREGARRRLRLRRELQADAPLEGDGRVEGRDADHRRRLLGHRLRPVRGRPQDRPTCARRRRCSATATESEVWVANADGTQRRAGDEERASRRPTRAISPDNAQRAVHLADRTRSSRPTTTAGCSSRPPAAARRACWSARASRSTSTARSGRRTASRSTSSPTSACTRSCSSCRRPAASRGS